MQNPSEQPNQNQLPVEEPEEAYGGKYPAKPRKAADKKAAPRGGGKGRGRY